MDARPSWYPCPNCDTNALAAYLVVEGTPTIRTRCTDCGVQDVRAHTYRTASARIGRNVRSLQHWRREGMPTMTTDPEGYTIVAEPVLLAWYRDKLRNSPVHQYRLRAAAKAEGREYTPRKPQQARKRVSGVTDGAERQAAVFGPRHKGAISDLTPAAKGGISDVTLVEPVMENSPAVKPEPVIAPLADTAAAAYAALTSALEATKPGCADVDAFTADKITSGEAKILAGICAACPVLDMCTAFAEASRPAAGFWAGRNRRIARSSATAA